MKRRNRFFAGLIGAAVLMQGAGSLPFSTQMQPIQAAAEVTAQTIQTRVFSYDFGDFKALYDTKTGKWYTEKGKPIESETQAVQRIENPRFGEKETDPANEAQAVLINMEEKTLIAEMGDGTLQDMTGFFDEWTIQDEEAVPEPQNPLPAVMFDDSIPISMESQNQLFVMPEDIPEKVPNAGDYYAVVEEYSRELADGQTEEKDILRLYLNRGEQEQYDISLLSLNSISLDGDVLNIELVEEIVNLGMEFPGIQEGGIYHPGILFEKGDLPAFETVNVTICSYEEYAANYERINPDYFEIFGNHQMWMNLGTKESLDIPWISAPPRKPFYKLTEYYAQPYALPKDVFSSSDEKEPVRIYREPEDTENEALKEILANGEDIVGVFAKLSNTGSFWPQKAVLGGNQLRVQMGCEKPSKDKTIMHYGVYFRFPDGTLPDDLKVTVASQVYQTYSFADCIDDITAITPEYAPQYYDKAQQKNVDVPEPDGFPLTYVWRYEPAEDGGGETFCDIMFGENRYGTCRILPDKINFTRENEQDAEALPFTDNGDVTIDGQQDVSDAVLTCRTVAEDEKTPISALGIELADKDGDGYVTALDATNILKDVAHQTEKTVPNEPAGNSVQVLSQKKQDICETDDPDAWTAAAQSFGYESAEALHAVFDGNQREEFSMYQLIRGEEYDTLRIGYLERNGSAVQIEILSMTMSENGALTVKCDECRSSAALQPILYVRELTLPKDALPDIQYFYMNGVNQPYPKQDPDVFAASVPEQLSISLPERQTVPQEPEIPVTNTVQVISQTKVDVRETDQRAEWDTIAKNFGYLSGEALHDEFYNKQALVKYYLQRGADTDRLSLAYVRKYGSSMQFEIQGMEVDENGVLNIKGGLYMFGDTLYPIIYYRELFFPHGALPDITNVRLTGLDETVYKDAEAFAADTPEQLTVTVQQQPEAEQIDLWSVRYVNYDNETMAQKLGYADDQALQDEIAKMNINEFAWAVCTEEGEELDKWLLVHNQFAEIYRQDEQTVDIWDNCRISSMQLGADGILDINMEYSLKTVSLSSIEEPYSNRSFMQAEVTLPHGALPPYLWCFWHITEAETGTLLGDPWSISAEIVPERAVPVMSLYFRDLTNGYRQSELERVFGCADEDAFFEKYHGTTPDIAGAGCASAFVISEPVMTGRKGVKELSAVLYSPELNFSRSAVAYNLTLDSSGILTISVSDPAPENEKTNHYLWLNLDFPEDAAQQPAGIRWEINSEGAENPAAARWYTTDPHLGGDAVVFTVSEAVYDRSHEFNDDHKEVKSCVIFDAEQLRENRIQPVKAYADDFFDDHALIFVCVFFGYAADESPVITDVSCIGNEIDIYAEKETGINDWPEYWCAFLEVSKADIAEVNENAVFRYIYTSEWNGHRGTYTEIQGYNPDTEDIYWEHYHLMVYQEPDKMTYQIGEALDLTGGIVSCKFPEYRDYKPADAHVSFTEPITSDLFTIKTDFDSSKAGIYSVTVIGAEGKATDTFTVEVVPNASVDFVESEADYSKFSAFDGNPEDAKSCVIYDAEQLRENPVHPVKAYSDDFFEDHALIFVCERFNSMANASPVVTDVKCSGNEIVIDADRESALMDAIEWWCTFLEVSKEDIAEVTENAVFSNFRADFRLVITEGDGNGTQRTYTVIQKYNPDNDAVYRETYSLLAYQWPDQMTYQLGEELDLTGGKMGGCYPEYNGDSAAPENVSYIAPMDSEMFTVETDFDSSKPGIYTVTVIAADGKASNSFTVEVVPN